MTPETTAALRRAVLRRRDALPESERVLLSRLIIASVLDLPAYENADVVLAYASFGTELRMPSSAEIARIVKDAQRMRAEAQAGLLRSAGRGITRLGRAIGRPLALAISGPGSTARMRRAS